MADNTTLNTGTGGSVVADDDIGGVKFQRVKLIHGADGVNAGDVSTANGLPTKQVRSATPVQTSVVNAIATTSLLASNANRLGATIFNDDTANTGATLRVKLGATASATSFTVAIAAQGYYEIPFNYTGAIDGIASAATGNARITELTA